MNRFIASKVVCCGRSPIHLRPASGRSGLNRERCRNAAGRIEKVGQCIGDVLLIDVKAGKVREAGFEVQEDVVGVIAQAVAGALRQVGIGERTEACR